MHAVASTILFVFIARSCAKKLATKNFTEKQDIGGERLDKTASWALESLDKLVVKSSERLRKAADLCRVDLDNAILGKSAYHATPYHSAIPPLLSRRVHLPCNAYKVSHASLAPVNAAANGRTAYEIIKGSSVFDPRDGKRVSTLDGLGPKSLVVLMCQLGDFDSMEYTEQLGAVLRELADAELDLRIVAIGDADSARRFAKFLNFPIDKIRIDPNASLHRALGLHAGPGWNAPEFLPGNVRPAVKGWLNYLAMCLFISTPGHPWALNIGTLTEVFRGFVGDRSSPERLTPDTSVNIGLVTLNATGEYRIGPWTGDISFWKDEGGYLRPVELAAVRLRTIAEVWFNLNKYVKNPEHLAQRGATYVFEEGETMYEWKDRGLLQYSENMSRPLSFLKSYIGSRALNPLGLGDIRS